MKHNELTEEQIAERPDLIAKALRILAEKKEGLSLKAKYHLNMAASDLCGHVAKLIRTQLAKVNAKGVN